MSPAISAVISQSIAGPGARSASAPVVAGGVPERPGTLARLVATIVWAPMSRSNLLVAATGRALLELPLESDRTILRALESDLKVLSDGSEGAAGGGTRRMAMRVLSNALGCKLLFGAGNHHAAMSIELCDFEQRGTGGVLMDAAKGYDENDVLLVIDGTQIFSEPLEGLVHELAKSPADVSFFAHADQSPSLMMLVRCGCLRGLPRLGNIDFKTQALPQISRDHRIQVVKRATASGMQVEDLSGYIGALQRYHRQKQAGKSESDGSVGGAKGAEWQPVFSVVETGADVTPGSHLYDTVVMRGGKVGAAATVVRSVVLPGGVVRRKETRTDCLIGKV